MKKVGFASGEVSLLRRVLGNLGNPPMGEAIPKSDYKAAQRILDKLLKAETPSEPAVNAPAIEETLVTYSQGKVARLALPNWQRYARQGAQASATVADAQTIGSWMSRQGWMQPGSQTLQSVLNNWSSWLGKARAAETGTMKPQAGLTSGQVVQTKTTFGGGIPGHAGPSGSPSRPPSGFNQRAKAKPMP
jgi:hypothetical protein